MARIRVTLWIGSVEPVDIGQQNQKRCMQHRSHLGGERVVVADTEFRNGDGVVFVDNRDGVQFQQTLDGVLEILMPHRVCNVVCRQQNLRDGVAVFREQLVVSIHQLALAHGCGGLLCHHIFGAGNLQLAHAKAGCAGRYNNQLVPGVFDVTPHFYQCFGVADVQPPARMGQRAGADLDNNAHQFFPISFVLS